MTKERPTLFNAPMVDGILDDLKTQTRRVIKTQPVIHKNGSFSWDFEFKSFSGAAGTHIEDFPKTAAFYCPHGSVGDQLWVRENIRFAENYEGWKPSEIPEEASIEYCAGSFSDNGEENWNANPWVWVIEFERIKS